MAGWGGLLSGLGRVTGGGGSSRSAFGGYNFSTPKVKEQEFNTALIDAFQTVLERSRRGEDANKKITASASAKAEQAQGLQRSADLNAELLAAQQMQLPTRGAVSVPSTTAEQAGQDLSTPKIQEQLVNEAQKEVAYQERAREKEADATTRGIFKEERLGERTQNEYEKFQAAKDRASEAQDRKRESRQRSLEAGTIAESNRQAGLSRQEGRLGEGEAPKSKAQYYEAAKSELSAEQDLATGSRPGQGELTPEDIQRRAAILETRDQAKLGMRKTELQNRPAPGRLPPATSEEDIAAAGEVKYAMPQHMRNWKQAMWEAQLGNPQQAMVMAAESARQAKEMAAAKVDQPVESAGGTKPVVTTMRSAGIGSETRVARPEPKRATMAVASGAVASTAPPVPPTAVAPTPQATPPAQFGAEQLFAPGVSGPTPLLSSMPPAPPTQPIEPVGGPSLPPQPPQHARTGGENAPPWAQAAVSTAGELASLVPAAFHGADVGLGKVSSLAGQAMGLPPNEGTASQQFREAMVPSGPNETTIADTAAIVPALLNQIGQASPKAQAGIAALLGPAVEAVASMAPAMAVTGPLGALGKLGETINTGINLGMTMQAGADGFEAAKRAIKIGNEKGWTNPEALGEIGQVLVDGVFVYMGGKGLVGGKPEAPKPAEPGRPPLRVEPVQPKPVSITHEQAPAETVDVYGSGQTGHFTTDQGRAASYPGEMYKVGGVPREVFEAGKVEAAKLGQPTPLDTFLPDEWVKRAEKVEKPDVTHVIEEPSGDLAAAVAEAAAAVPETGMIVPKKGTSEGLLSAEVSQLREEDPYVDSRPQRWQGEVLVSEPGGNVVGVTIWTDPDGGLYAQVNPEKATGGFVDSKLNDVAAVKDQALRTFTAERERLATQKAPKELPTPVPKRLPPGEGAPVEPAAEPAKPAGGKWDADPATLTASEVNRNLDHAEKIRKAAYEKMTEGAPGDEKIRDTERRLGPDNPLVVAHDAAESRFQALRDEIRARTGNDYNRMPRGFKPRTKAEPAATVPETVPPAAKPADDFIGTAGGKMRIQGKTEEPGQLRKFAQSLTKPILDRIGKMVTPEQGRPVGKAIAEGMRFAEQYGDTEAARYSTTFEKALAKAEKSGGSWDRVRDVLDGKAQYETLSEPEKALWLTTRSILNKTKSDAQTHEVFTDQSVGNYFPHMIGEKASFDNVVDQHLHWLESTPEGNVQLEKLRARDTEWVAGLAGPAANRELASMDLARNTGNNTWYRKNPHLEKVRTDWDSQNYRTDSGVITDYLKSAYPRIGFARYLGPKGEMPMSAAGALSPWDQKYVAEAVQSKFGTRAPGTYGSGAISTVAREGSSLMGLTKLGLSQVRQISQAAYPIAHAVGRMGVVKGVKNVVRGAFDFATTHKQVVEDASRAGSMVSPSEMSDRWGGASKDTVVGRAVKAGFSLGGKFEAGKKFVESTYGMKTADDMVRQFTDRTFRYGFIDAVEAKNAKFLTEMLGTPELAKTAMGLDPAALRKGLREGTLGDPTITHKNWKGQEKPIMPRIEFGEGGRLMDLAAKRMSDKTNFRTGQLNTPLAFGKPLMRMFNTFMAFPYQAWRWNVGESKGLRNSVAAGDYAQARVHAKTLAAFHLATAPMIGSMILAGQSLLKGRGLNEQDIEDLKQGNDSPGEAVRNMLTAYSRVSSSKPLDTSKEDWVSFGTALKALQGWQYAGGIGYPLAIAERTARTFNLSGEEYGGPESRALGALGAPAQMAGEPALEIIKLVDKLYNDPHLTDTEKNQLKRRWIQLTANTIMPNPLGLGSAVTRHIKDVAAPSKTFKMTDPGWTGFLFGTGDSWNLEHGVTSEAKDVERARQRKEEIRKKSRDRMQRARP